MCNFCEKGKVPNLKSGKINLEVYLEGCHLIIETYDSEDKYNTVAEINYCPVCGRALRPRERILSEKELIGI